MAGGQERILRRRIRSVQSTRKITKAMELIAASRIVRAQNRIAANRPFREGMERVLRLAAAADPIAAKKLLGTPESPQHVGILLIAGDRGLAGSYNSGVLRLTERTVAEYRAAGTEVTVWSVGKKAPAFLRFRGIEVAQSFVGVADRPEFGDARRIASIVAAPFDVRRGRPGADDLDPLRLRRHPARRADADAAPARCPKRPAWSTRRTGRSRATPSSSRSRRSCWSSWPHGPWRRRSSPRCSKASAAFFTAQQRAMAAATENADELVRTLTRVMNRARQDAITTEIMEIVGGAEALRHSKGA